MEKSLSLRQKLAAAFVFVVILTRLIPVAFGQSADKIGSLYEKISWRAMGPAVMGGRTVDIEAAERTPRIIYAAIGPSGVWKSENNGVTWMPVFHKEATVSAGDIAIAQSHPDIVWAGTGEATCRNSVTIGAGIHPDHHALWIDPSNPRHLLKGNDLRQEQPMPLLMGMARMITRPMFIKLTITAKPGNRSSRTFRLAGSMSSAKI